MAEGPRGSHSELREPSMGRLKEKEERLEQTPIKKAKKWTESDSEESLDEVLETNIRVSIHTELPAAQETRMETEDNEKPEAKNRSKGKGKGKGRRKADHSQVEKSSEESNLSVQGAGANFQLTLASIVSRLDETDLRLLLRVWSARTSKNQSPEIGRPADVMMDMAKNAYLSTGDLGVLEKDMIAAGISFPAAVRGIPGVPDEMKHQRTVEAAVGPIGGEVEIPGFVKLIVPPGILQRDTMITISTVDVAAILGNPESLNWISGYPWSMGEDACPRELLEQVLFCPAFDVNLHGAQLNGYVKLQTWRPPGSEGMGCVLLRHHDGEGWADVTASTSHHIDSDTVSMLLQTFSIEDALMAPVKAVKTVGKVMRDAFSYRTLDCSFTSYISPCVNEMEFHLVCRDRRAETKDYRPGFKQCGSNDATAPLFNGDIIKVNVSLHGYKESKEVPLRAELCKQDGQKIQMRLNRPDTSGPTIGEVEVLKSQYPHWLSVCELTFRVQAESGDIFRRDDPTTTVTRKKKKKKSGNEETDNGPGPSGGKEGTSKTADVESCFENVIAGVGYKWEDLARELGFSRPEIIGLRNSKQDDNSTCREMLHKWWNKKGSKATLQILEQALINIDESLTAESL